MVNQDENESKVGTTTCSRLASHHACSLEVSATEEDDLDHTTQLTCDVLCSLMGSAPAGSCSEQMSAQDSDEGHSDCKLKVSKGCSKQLQLPMFLSKTYHMISRSDPEIASWSDAGDNFVIKNVDKFAASVLPLYFKHSNFSSFARQLNFYGFRKMRSDPILTSDVDPQTAGHVRFYHDKFQKDKPELLQQIKRATKTDQQSKDEIDSLRHEVACLREALSATTSEYERRLAEMSYDFNRRLSATNVEFDNLAALVHRFIATCKGENAALAAAALRELPGSQALTSASGQGQDPLHSLSHIATLHQGHAAMRQPPSSYNYNPPTNAKRKADEKNKATQSPSGARPRVN